MVGHLQVPADLARAGQSEQGRGEPAGTGTIRRTAARWSSVQRRPFSGMAAISDRFGVSEAVPAPCAGADIALWVTTKEVPAAGPPGTGALRAGELPMSAVDRSVRGDHEGPTRVWLLVMCGWRPTAYRRVR